MSPVMVSFEGQSRSHNEETYWGSGNSSLAEGSCERSLNGNPCKESGLGVPPNYQASVTLGWDSLFLSCHPSLLRLLLVLRRV